MNNTERRTFMKGVGAFAFTMGGTEMLLTPRQARAQGMPLRTLTSAEGETLDAIGETLVPGAKQAGISNFVDQQISIPPEEALLQARILNVPPPFAKFYRAAIAAIDGAQRQDEGSQVCAALARRPARFRQFDAAEQVGRLAGSARTLRLRGSAQRRRRCRLRDHGRLRRLGVPYMPHIAPTKRW